MIFSRTHIPSAALLLLLTMSVFSGCGGRQEMRWLAVYAALRAGYPDVDHITPAELADLLQKEPLPVLLDVRGPDEYGVSHLAGAINAPDEPAALAILERVPPEATIIAYCSLGIRSAALARRLHTHGYSSVKNLEGSIFRWANEGHPLYWGNEEVETVHPHSERWGKLLDSRLRWRDGDHP